MWASITFGHVWPRGGGGGGNFPTTDSQDILQTRKCHADANANASANANANANANADANEIRTKINMSPAWLGA